MTLPMHSDATPIPTGVPGLDDILAGGYAGDRAHLIEGRPGSGKTTFLSDAVVLLRPFESDGRIRRALSVVKRRTGPHVDTIREFRIDSQGLRVGPPLEQFRGVLTGVPTFEGQRASLLEERETDNDAGR